jgi:formylglycine-generating enzyme required for sulfatase activity
MQIAPQRSFKACLIVMTTLIAQVVVADDVQDAQYVSEPGSDAYMINGPECLAAQRLTAAQCAPGIHERFLEVLRHWRTERKIYTGYDDSRYTWPALQWTHSSFIQPQTIVEDRYLYDPIAGKYTVDRYLDDVIRRYGGIDSILIWPVYPNLGIDNRNQLDMIRAMPGGLDGVKRMIADFHRRGVRVLFPMNMWDQGTRDPGKPWPQAIAELMADLDVDGINGDTQDGVPLVFSQAAEQLHHPLAFQPQLFPSDEALAWNVLSWWEDDAAKWEGLAKHEQLLPKINRFKWLESRHMVNITDRWSRDKNGDLQQAFFNGIGFESWENIWGIWNGITPRDAEAIRRVATIDRAMSDFLLSPEWEPFYPMGNFGIFSSRWPLRDQTLWTIVNRNEYTVTERQLSVPFRDRERYFDLYHGVEIPARREGETTVLSFPIEGRGFGAVLATLGAPPPQVVALMNDMRVLTARPLGEFSNQWQPLTQHLVPTEPTPASKRIPPGMVEVPSGEFTFIVEGIEIEGGDEAGVDVAYPWEDGARRFHQHVMTINRFYLDQFPVTNEKFQRFMDASHYRPKDALNFLKDWKEGHYPEGWGDRPVTWVSIEDARAYAAWAGKRLPHEWEWQYAAQGTQGRLYPWGSTWDPDAVPKPERSRTLRGPDDVKAHPSGASPFGVMDMVGNVWQWTDEYVDTRTRAAIVRGGSYYQPSGSSWYFPQAYRNDQHGKLLLMAPSKDRAATLGFRCAADAEPNAGRQVN